MSRRVREIRPLARIGEDTRAGVPAVRSPGGESDNHGSVVAGAGSIAAGETVIGTITLPANGPWSIWGVWVMIAAATETAGESFGGNLRLNALDGDLEPNPAPVRIPTGMGGSFLGATVGVRACPLKVWPIDFQAPGKARIQMIYDEASAVTVATQVVCGLLYGKTFPSFNPITYIDRVRNAIVSAVDTSIGTITLSEKSKMITGIGVQITQDGVLTTAEELLGFLRLSSDDVNLAPSQWPLNAAYSAGLGALIGQSNIIIPDLIPVNIPVPGGARINCFIDLNTAITNAAEVEVFLSYE